MIEALTRPRWLWVSIFLGAYSALIALVRTPVTALALLAPALFLSLCWWIFIGPPNRWLMTFLCAAILLPPLPIALGDSGPHPCLAIAALGLIAGLLRPRDWRVPADGLSRAIIFLFFVLLASVALAAYYSGPLVALGTLVRVMLFGISVYVFFYVTRGPGVPDWRFARTLFLAGVASALFACVDFYFQFPAPAGFGPQYVWLDSGVYRRAQGLFYEASTLGNFCAFFLVMTAVALLRPKKDGFVNRPVLLCGAAVFAVALVLSYSRASLINVAIAVGTLLWLRRSRIRFRQIGWLALPAAGAAAAAAYYLFPVFTRLYWDRLSASAFFLFSSTEGVLSGRLSSWRALTDFLLANPSYALLGVGYKTLPYSNVIGQPVVGDNMYLTMLVETGVGGLSALLFLHVAILKSAYRAARNADSRVSFFGTWIFCFWMGQMFQMLSGDLLTYWRVLPLYFWALAVAVRAADEHSLPRSVQ
jgi:hypothetical protein